MSLLVATLVGTHLWPSALKPEAAHWFELILASATVCAGLTRRLPLQNVVLIAALIVLVVGAGQVLKFAAIGGGARALESVHFSVAWVVLWIPVVLNSRGLVRLALWPFRGREAIGIWSIAVASMVVLSELRLWGPALHVGVPAPALPSPWNLAVEALLALAVNVAITPALIDKRPVPPRIDFQPLSLWAVLTLAAVLG